LLQHEIDHLDGILAVDRAADADSIVARTVYDTNKDVYDKQVDYAIIPTIDVAS
jgi:peptide deformylase